MKKSELNGGTVIIGDHVRPVISNAEGNWMKTIKTPSTFTIDPRRYHIERKTTPQQIPNGTTPGIEINMDYALLAADLDVMGYPDELTAAIQALGPDHGKVPMTYDATTQTHCGTLTGVGTWIFTPFDHSGAPITITNSDGEPGASIFDHATQTWKPMDIERGSKSIVRERHPDAFCQPVSVLESMPPRVKTWQVCDSNNEPLGSVATTEEGAWEAAHNEIGARK